MQRRGKERNQTFFGGKRCPEKVGLLQKGKLKDTLFWVQKMQMHAYFFIICIWTFWRSLICVGFQHFSQKRFLIQFLKPILKKKRCVYLFERAAKTKRERSSTHWFITQMATMAGTEPDQSQEPGASFRSSCMSCRTPSPGLSSDAFSRPLVGTPIETEPGLEPAPICDTTTFCYTTTPTPYKII